MAIARRNQLVIVALPTKNDYVRKISSEKEPHLTLLYLGEPDYDGNQLAQIEDYVGYASTLLHQFTLEVDRRGELGDKNADVLFFHKDYSCKAISTFREHLLQDPLISAAYNAEDQFEGWTPHLTLGYPETPAKKDPNGYGADVTFVQFDRIALWIEDAEGPTFDLKPYRYDMEVAMSQIKSPSSIASEIGESLKHYGVKGMKWGVRRSESSGSKSPKPSPSEDARRAAASRTKARQGGVKALTTKELQDLTQRMNLEQQYNTMLAREPGKIERGHSQVKKTLSVAKTAQDVYNVVNSPAGKALRKAIIGV